jgi:lipoyl(octanoyl) transferase
MRFLEEAVILTLRDFDIEAGRIDGLTGVWVDYIQQKNPRKICAMGVKASRWVTMHGLALNVNTDLHYFNYIVPCGIDDKAVTSMNFELGKDISMNEVELVLKSHLANLFEMSIIDE